ncbi:helix-turn-helix domain-containing protein [Nocardia halotolerans]|uniref:Helix-turn-helix domain-containing protein n=1 Tax=Nocardia halotolerans TaxID=1755878 RepID=A0ABV8VBJ3_9NOCA
MIDAETRSLTALTVEVLDFLKPAGSHTPAELATKLGAPVAQVREALATLARSGCVSQHLDGGWDVVPVLRRNRAEQ